MAATWNRVDDKVGKRSVETVNVGLEGGEQPGLVREDFLPAAATFSSRSRCAGLRDLLVELGIDAASVADGLLTDAEICGSGADRATDAYHGAQLVAFFVGELGGSAEFGRRSLGRFCGSRFLWRRAGIAGLGRRVAVKTVRLGGWHGSSANGEWGMGNGEWGQMKKAHPDAPGQALAGSPIDRDASMHRPGLGRRVEMGSRKYPQLVRAIQRYRGAEWLVA